MKKILLTALMLSSLFGQHSLEESFSKKNSYSYGVIGLEVLNYKESIFARSLGKQLNSEVTITSPVYMTGSYTIINKDFAFSIDAISTLIMNSDDEKWHLGGNLSQTNQAAAMLSDLKLLLHYNLKANKHKFLFGPILTNFSMERYEWKQNGKKIKGVGLSKESVTTLFLNLGYKYENTPFYSPKKFRYSIAGLIGKPIFRKASNTQFEKVDFDTLSGYTYEINSYIGYKIFKQVELGVFLDYSFTKKDKTHRKSNGTAWPENELSVFKSGLKLKWNFN